MRFELKKEKKKKEHDVTEHVKDIRDAPLVNTSHSCRECKRIVSAMASG